MDGTKITTIYRPVYSLIYKIRLDVCNEYENKKNK